MKTIISSCFAFLLPISIATASIAPYIPANLMPPAQRPNVPIPGMVDLPAPLPDPAGPMTLQRLKNITVSGILYKTLLDEIGQNAAGSNALSMSGAAVGLTSPLRSRLTDPRSIGSLTESELPSSLKALPTRLHIDSNAITVGGTKNVTNDSYQGIEPTTASVNISGTQNTTTITTKYVPCWNNSSSNCPTLYAYHTTDLQNYSGEVRLQVPIDQRSRQQAWDSMGDPLMSGNPYTGGVWGKRMYCTGIMWNSGHAYDESSAVAVWHSDDGGASWSNPAIVDSVNGGGYTMDKPAIAVSWEQGASLGYVYVAYIVANGSSGTLNQLRVAVSTDGGSTFSPVTLTTAYVEFPQVVVDSNGVVNPIWVNLTVNNIETTQSYTYGSSYLNAPSGPFDLVSNSFVIHGQTIPGFASGRGNSVPMARYNFAAGRISLVYYGLDANGNYQVYYDFKPGCTTCNSAGWPSEPAQVTNSAYNHFNASLDYNKSTGYLIVPYYRSYTSGGITYYDEFASYIDPSGTVQQPLEFQVSPSPSSQAYVQNWWYPGFIGDYQDVWDDYYPTTEEALTAWIGVGVFPNSSASSDDCQTPVSY